MSAPTPRTAPENEYESYGWLPAYQAALSEANQMLLPERVTRARETIIKRRVRLRKGGADDREIQALELALKTLRVLHSNWV
jgi:hypothetical protein